MGLEFDSIDNNNAIASVKVKGGLLMNKIFELIGSYAERHIGITTPWTNVYGLARTIIALASASTLICTRTSILFGSSAGSRHPIPMCVGPARSGLFCIFGSHVVLAQFVAVIILLITATGWRPRVIGVLHWWVCFSIAMNATLIDGGDQVAAILTMLLILVTLLDSRPWHWQESSSPSSLDEGHIVAFMALILIRLQVAVIYFHAAVAKMAVTEWIDGTAVYYWFTHPYFGPPSLRLYLLMPLLTNSVTVAMISWGTIGLELLLFLGLLASKRVWSFLLFLGVAFHILIAAVHGLISFSLIMIGSLILYLRPVEQPFHLPDRIVKNFIATAKSVKQKYAPAASLVG